MRLRFIWIGKTRDRAFLELEERYLKRLNRFFPTERALVREGKKIDPRQYDATSRREAIGIEGRLSGGSRLVVLDVEGLEFSSEQLASFLEEVAGRGAGEVTFVVGGHAGVPKSIREAADLRFSLSRLTLPHELARVFLLEQVYRAIAILKGLPYHR